MADRLRILQRTLPENLGAALITSEVNRRYYTGFRSSAGTLVVTRKKAYYIVDSRYYEAACAAIGDCEIILQDKLNEQIHKLLKQHRVKRLGIESRSVTVSALQGYAEAFAGIEIDTGDALSEQIILQRAVKSEEELIPMREAQRIADAAFLYILNVVESGRTEQEIAVELELYCRKNGADGMSFSTIVASGPNSSRPHAQPGQRRITSGDFVTMDFGCLVDGYCSDMTRTVAVGAVSPRQRECYETVLAAHLAAMAAIHDGAAGKDIDKTARDIIDVSEFKGYFGHGLGHGLGMEVHERPLCSAASRDILCAGMVNSVEPGIYIPGEFGVRIEDCVIVTKTGCESLAASPKELIVL